MAFHPFLRCSDKPKTSQRGLEEYESLECEERAKEDVPAAGEERREKETEEMGKRTNPFGMSDSGKKWKQFILIGERTWEAGRGGVVSIKK